jgi:transcriptional regulator with XRE-family HTH domain
MTLGQAIRDERHRRLTMRDLAARARVSASTVNNVESGRRVSFEVYARLAVALGLPLQVSIDDGRARTARERSDMVHSAMAEVEVAMLSRHAFRLAVDEPYQHFHFAGRADLLAWTTAPAALLHIENRTRFPDIGETAGSFNAKCRYLPAVLAQRLGIRAWAAETHAIVGLWSSEVIHAVRAREATFRTLCPDDEGALLGWFSGQVPRAEVVRCFALLDPVAHGRQRSVVGLEALLNGVRPRFRDYREAAERLRVPGRG